MSPIITLGCFLEALSLTSVCFSLVPSRPDLSLSSAELLSSLTPDAHIITSYAVEFGGGAPLS